MDLKPEKLQNVGGQAVIEGVMMRSPRAFSVAVRAPDGSIVVRRQLWEGWFQKWRFLRLPFLRGIVVLFETVHNGFSALYFSAEIAASAEGQKLTNKDSANKTERLALWGSMFFAIILAILLFKFVPHLLTMGISNLFALNLSVESGWFHIIDGVIKLAIFLAYIWVIGLMPDMRRVFEYHGAEHKTIACYEKGLDLTVENARTQSRFHPRCGTSFLIVVIAVSIFLFAAVFKFLPPLATNKVLNVVLQVLIKVPLLLPVAGIAYEFIKLAGKPGAPRWLRFFAAPGLWTQHLTTREPDDSMLEVAIVSLKTVLEIEEAIEAGTNPKLGIEELGEQPQEAA